MIPRDYSWIRWAPSSELKENMEAYWMGEGIGGRIFANGRQYYVFGREISPETTIRVLGTIPIRVEDKEFLSITQVFEPETAFDDIKNQFISHPPITSSSEENRDEIEYEEVRSPGAEKTKPIQKKPQVKKTIVKWYQKLIKTSITDTKGKTIVIYRPVDNLDMTRNDFIPKLYSKWMDAHGSAEDEDIKSIFDQMLDAIHPLPEYTYIMNDLITASEAFPSLSIAMRQCLTHPIDKSGSLNAFFRTVQGELEKHFGPDKWYDYERNLKGPIVYLMDWWTSHAYTKKEYQTDEYNQLLAFLARVNFNIPTRPNWQGMSNATKSQRVTNVKNAIETRLSDLNRLRHIRIISYSFLIKTRQKIKTVLQNDNYLSIRIKNQSYSGINIIEEKYWSGSYK